MKKKVLIISYYWPPSGGPGVQRWLKFVKYLPQFDIEPIVVIPKNASYPIIDNEWDKTKESNPEVIRVPIFEPNQIFKFFSRKKANQLSSGMLSSNPTFFEKALLYLRGNLFIPDARKYWKKKVVKTIEAYLKKNPEIDTLITTGPPHSIHLIGKALKYKTPLRWIADFRDPWTTISYHQHLRLSKSSRQRHKKLEEQVLNSCDDIIVTSPKTKSNFEKLTDKPIHLITNGFDFDIPRLKPNPEVFKMSYVGSLLRDRNPLLLWEVLSDLCHENKDFNTCFELHFYGKQASNFKEIIAHYKLDSTVHFHGYVSHNNAIEVMSSSQVLLLIEINSEQTSEIIPGKLFEYIGVNRPVLALGPENWSAGELITALKAGSYITYSQKNDLKTFLLKAFDQFKNNSLDLALNESAQFHRKKLTQDLATIILNHAVHIQTNNVQ